MTSASLDRLLAVLVVLLAATGLVSLRAGSPDQGWVFAIHGVLAGGLAVAAGLKVRRSVPRALNRRAWSRLGLGLIVSLSVAAALSGGYLWVASGTIIWVDVAGLTRWTLLTLHAWIGLFLVPLVVIHVLPRRWRLLRPRGHSPAHAAAPLLTRRSVLLGGGFLAAGLGLRGLADLAEAIRGGRRRFTGSRWLPAGGTPPPTTFFGEPAPELDRAAWRLRAGERTFSLAELQALGGTTRTAVLDCTSGWAIETEWHGVPMAAVLGAASLGRDGRIVVRSATGWATSLSDDEVDRCLLAWGCAGDDLAVGNGAPLRLVIPDRRGLDWVKWVTEVERA